jgi:hypothetical protein
MRRVGNVKFYIIYFVLDVPQAVNYGLILLSFINELLDLDIISNISIRNALTYNEDLIP